MNESLLPSFSELSADVLSHSLSFLDDEEFIESACHQEDVFSLFGSPLQESLGRRWKAMWDKDQHRTFPQWKPQSAFHSHHCSQCDDDDDDDDESETLRAARKTGLDFLRDINMTRHLAKLSHQYYDYNRIPVPFFCPVPTKKCGGCASLDLESELEPSSWPKPCPRTTTGCNNNKYPFVFLNLSFRDDNCVYRLWEGYRPIEELSTSQFLVFLDVESAQRRQEANDDSDLYNPLEVYYRKLVTDTEVHQQTQPESEEKGLDVQQLSTLLRKLQVTIVYDGELVVATGGCHLVLSASKGQLHNRPYYVYNKRIQRKLNVSTISTTIEFRIDQSNKDERLLCMQVSRS